MNDEHYMSGLAVEQAMKAAAKREHLRHPERNIADIDYLACWASGVIAGGHRD